MADLQKVPESDLGDNFNANRGRRTTLLSNLENEALLEKSGSPNLSVFIKLYFITMGFANSIYLFLLMASMHYFKQKYSRFTFSIWSMFALKFPVFMLFPFVPYLSKVSLTPWIIGTTVVCYIFLILSFITAWKMPNTGAGLALCLALQATGALVSLASQAINLRVLLFYHYSSVAYYYASGVVSSLVLSSLGLLLVELKVEGEKFMCLMLSFVGLVVVFACIMQLQVGREATFVSKSAQAARGPQLTFESFKNSISTVRETAGILLVTLTLTAITYRTIFYELNPSIISQAVWINITNLVVNSSEFFGRLFGDLFRLNFIIHSLDWYPWLYNLIICGLFIWSRQQIYNDFWGLFWPLIILLTFRNGFAITYYQSKIAAKNLLDPNCIIIGHFAKEAGNALGAVISLALLALKNYLH